MACFQEAIGTILEHEGGFVDHPKDPGGATNWGISSRFLRQHGLPDDVRTLSRTRAVQIYRVFFWRSDWEHLHYQRLATKLFDLSVNVGPCRRTKIVQEALCARGHQLAVDGTWGPLTWGALLREDRAGADPLLEAICDAQEKFYRELVAENPEKEVFLAGWLRRAEWRG
jgi:lysozyme family protein